MSGLLNENKLLGTACMCIYIYMAVILVIIQASFFATVDCWPPS